MRKKTQSSVATFAPEKQKTSKTAVAKLKIPMTPTADLDKVVGDLLGKAVNAHVSYTHVKGVLTLF